MIANSLINSVNSFNEQVKTTKPAKSSCDDRFRNLIRKDDGNNKTITEQQEKPEKNITEKADKDTSERESSVVPECTPDISKILPADLAEMVADINKIQEIIIGKYPELKDKIQKIETVLHNIRENAAGRIENGYLKNIITDRNGYEEKIKNAVESFIDGRQVRRDEIADGISEKIRNIREEHPEIKIRPDEGFRKIKENSESVKILSPLKEMIKEKGFVEENIKDHVSPNMTTVHEIKTNTESPLQVKTAEVTAKDENVFRPEETINRMVKNFVREFNQGRREMEIALEPENLGKLTIKVAYEAGKAVVSILCNERNLDIISRNSAQLGMILQEYTGEDTKIYVENSRPDYLNQSDEQNGNQQNREDRYEDKSKDSGKEDNMTDFVEQLRLGLVKEV